MAKKQNGSAPEVVYKDGEGLASDLVTALERVQAEGAGPRGDQMVFRVAANTYEAAVLPHQRGELLFVGIPRAGKPPTQWHAVARFDRRTIGSHEFLEARPYRGPLTAPVLARLDQAFGRDEFAPYLHGETEPAEPVALEAAALVHLSSGSRALHVRHRGLWFAVTRFTKPAPIGAGEPGRAEQGYNYPQTSIV